MTIRVDVRRENGDVTRLEGPAAVAIVLQKPVPTVDKIPDTNAAALAWAKSINWPAVSVRATEPEEVVVMLATLMAVANRQGSELLEAAMWLAPYVRINDTMIKRGRR